MSLSFSCLVLGYNLLKLLRLMKLNDDMIHKERNSVCQILFESFYNANTFGSLVSYITLVLTRLNFARGKTLDV